MIAKIKIVQIHSVAEYNFFQLFQDLHHCPSVKLAIMEQGFSCRLSIKWVHILDFIEDRHSVVTSHLYHILFGRNNRIPN